MSSTRPKRSQSTWVVLTAELGLDLAGSVIPLLAPPRDDVAAFNAALHSLDPPPSFEEEGWNRIEQRISAKLASALGEASSRAWLDWMRDFPCDGDDVLLAPRYWFNRLCQAGMPFRPPQVDEPTWTRLLTLFRQKPGSNPVQGTDDLSEAQGRVARVRNAYALVDHAVKQAQAAPVSCHDLEMLLRFDRNPDDESALSRIETGLLNAEMGAWWRAVEPVFTPEQQHAIEAAMTADDAANRRDVLADKAFGVQEAAHVGITREQFLADVFPEPKPAPRLAELAGLWGLPC